MNQKLEACYDAFERLKLGKGTHEECIGLPLNEITFSKISLEAGHTGGYLKKNRPQHQPLWSMLTLFLSELPKETTMGKGAAIEREKKKVANTKADKKNAEEKLHASLGRELQLYHQLKKVEGELVEAKLKLALYSNITQLPI